MLGHALRLEESAPAQKAMQYYFEDSEKLKKFKGQPRMTIAELLNKEIKEAANQFEECKQVTESFSTLNDLNKLRKFAQDKEAWSKYSELLSKSAQVCRSKSPQGRSTSVDLNA